MFISQLHACFLRGTLLLFYGLVIRLFTWQRSWKRNLRSRLIARCFGFPLHNFLTCSDSQKFRVSAYRRINTVVDIFTCIYNQYMASSIGRQDELNPVLWLATWIGKMELSCLRGSTRKKNFSESYIINPLLTKLVRS